MLFSLLSYILKFSFCYHSQTHDINNVFSREEFGIGICLKEHISHDVTKTNSISMSNFNSDASHCITERNIFPCNLLKSVNTNTVANTLWFTFFRRRKTYLIGYLVERRQRTERSVEFTDSALCLEKRHYLYSRVSNVLFSFRPFFFILRSRTRRFNKKEVRNPQGVCNVYLLVFLLRMPFLIFIFFLFRLTEVAMSTAVYLLSCQHWMNL